MIFNYFMTVSGVPLAFATFVKNLRFPPVAIVACILLTYLILGCIMDTLAMQVFTIPIFYPIVLSLGFDGIWFGVAVVLMSEMALITPPVGMNVFIIGGVARDIPLYDIFKGIVPFLLAMVLCMALLVAFPQLALLLPATMTK
jgi:TRAP-type C4-dicarboxylate transport system permease large subunit